MPPIFLILGTPAAGKSTVARALMERFGRGLHLPVDDLRHMVVSGLAEPGFEWTDELKLQLRLARGAAARTALAYAGAGFAVAIDDFWQGETPDADYGPLQGHGVHRVLLQPSLEATLARLAARRPDEASFKGVLAQATLLIRADMDRHPKTGWQVVDSSDLSVGETVDRILEQAQVVPTG
ncbi:phosphotransferase-like protein [Deinococcus koreensis]|uniref:Phosphotransferase n=1 Tax=Deinococcus koreensis TaxID=2054903 RepID=A0A2K3UYZ4_9DEIO|nr:AAA family ATPase [Deinococcus koreensis]PNY81750.1 phosphotransferase [Deinococcus koreensis]